MGIEKVILLVEDDPDDEALTLRAFKKHAIANPIVVARDGQEAVDYLLGVGRHAQEPPEPPELVLLDLKLPKLDGLDVLAKVRGNERTKSTPVVVLTSSLEDRDMVRSYAQGANSYVQKPVNFDEFGQALTTLGVHWSDKSISPVPQGLLSRSR